MAEADRWVKKEDFVSELFFLFTNFYADSTLFFWPVSGSKSRIIPQKHTLNTPTGLLSH